MLFPLGEARGIFAITERDLIAQADLAGNPHMVNMIAASTGSLEIVTEFPNEVAIVHNLMVPVDARENPVPAIMGYAPFRHRDALFHFRFAGHGYASIRLELRGR